MKRFKYPILISIMIIIVLVIFVYWLKNEEKNKVKVNIVKIISDSKESWVKLPEGLRITIVMFSLSGIMIFAGVFIFKINNHYIKHIKDRFTNLAILTGLNDFSNTQSSFDYIRIRKPLICFSGIREGFKLEIAYVFKGGFGNYSKSSAYIVGLTCPEKFSCEISLMDNSLLTGFESVFGGIHTDLEFGNYSIWGKITQAEKSLLLDHKDAISNLPRKIDSIIINKQGILFVWLERISSNTIDAALLKKSFLLAISLCKSHN